MNPALLAVLLQNLPAILQSIMGIEQIFAGKKAAGVAKKALILNAVKIALPAPEHTEAISTLIDQSVATLNAAGVLPPKVV